MQHTEKMQKLIELVRLNPGVLSCIHRIICEVVPDLVTLSENGKPLTPDLQRLLGSWLSIFYKTALRWLSCAALSYLCAVVMKTLRFLCYYLLVLFIGV